MACLAEARYGQPGLGAARLFMVGPHFGGGPFAYPHSDDKNDS